MIARCIRSSRFGCLETSHSPAECTTLLRWSPLTGTRGSNPLVSAVVKARVPLETQVFGLFLFQLATELPPTA